MSDRMDANPAVNMQFNPMVWLLGFLVCALMFFVFYDGLMLMENWWGREEYSHGYMIPLVALFLFWQKRDEFVAMPWQGSAWGLLFMLGGLLLFMLGEMSAIYTLIQYGFLATFWGVVLAIVGIKPARLIWASLFYLFFMVPLPNFIYNNLSSQLQLISSQLGVGFLRLFDISVFLEGNVIDLGVYKLQVVEACSGLRYLFPLTSFGFLIAYLYRGPVWQKVVIFLSTIPITVLMNSFRIGVIGITVDNWGIQMAEGFLHDFEGWVVFMACLGVLLFEIWLFHLLTPGTKSFWDRFDLDFPDISLDKLKTAPSIQWSRFRMFWVLLLLLALAVPFKTIIGDRVDQVPERKSFTGFPLVLKGWFGREGALEDDVEEVLKLSDYFLGDYRKGGRGMPINFYVAWYASQRKGASIHSPASCLPGGGWQMTELAEYEVPGVTNSDGTPLVVNRSVIKMGDATQLVYYWFQGRSRNITNEYAAKWYIFWDGLTQNRTDGALVRVITRVEDGQDISSADYQLTEFVQAAMPLLPTYIPD